MAFCSNCGAPIDSGTKFCPNCGAPVETEQTVPAPSAPAANEPIYTPSNYTAAVQQNPQAEEPSYTPPGYTPPVQQGPQVQDYAPASVSTAVKEKKSPNLKILLIIGIAAAAIIIAIVLIIVFAGRGASESDDPNLGMYNAANASMMGTEIDVSDLFENGFSIELKPGGKCALNIDGQTGSGKWSLEDSVFHVKGGGIDCSGTLSGGIITLENVLDMGVTLEFAKEGGSPSDPGAGPAVPTAVQEQWNGTWYGAMYVGDATDSYSSITSELDTFDVYMYVDVNAQGEGTLAVYLSGSEEAFASADCEASESGLYCSEGLIAGGVSLNADNWMFLPMPEYPDQYTMGDSIEDDSGFFCFSLFMKKWGANWQDEIDSDFAIVPPSADWYMQAIASGEQPPSAGSSGAWDRRRCRSISGWHTG